MDEDGDVSTSEVLDQIDGALEDWAVGPDAMRCNAPADAGLSSTRRVIPRPHVEFLATVNIAPFVGAMQQMAATLARMTVPLKKIAQAMADVEKGYDENHPRPLCIDGHAYARRRKARKRRR